jgi:nucleoside-diphosphate-sugar epimerase
MAPSEDHRGSRPCETHPVAETSVTHSDGGAVGITGTGFIGTAIARRLRRDGHEVLGVDLEPDRTGEWAAMGARTMTGDITNADDMAAFCQGLDTVVHTAALVAESGELSLFEHINVTGTTTVADAARAAGVRRFVHFSSVMVYGFDYPDGITELGATDGAGNPYCITKIAAEAALADRHAPGEFDVFIIRPGDVYGPGSVPWVLRPFEAMRAGLWATVGPELEPLINHVYVDNLLDGVWTVLAAGRSGEPFVVTDRRRTTTMEFYGHLLAMLGINEVPAISATDATAFLDPEAVRYLTRRGQYSCDKVASLGYEPAVDLVEGMARTQAWLAEIGLLDPGTRPVQPASD